MSVRGGVHTAFARGTSIGCSPMQIFVKNANRWFARPLSDADIQSYKREEVKARISPVVAHASYLINLCATDTAILKKSRQAVADCVVELDATRAENDPKVFTAIHVHFIVKGTDLKDKHVARAVELSAEKYCSASIMLGKTAKITHDYEIQPV